MQTHFRYYLVEGDAAYTYTQEGSLSICSKLCGAISILIAAGDHMGMLTLQESV